jgi:prepilin-type processing-associated H-X9-DG protein
MVAREKRSRQSPAGPATLRIAPAVLFYRDVLSYAHDNREFLPPNISRRIQFDQVNVAVNGCVPWVLGNALIDTNTANIQAGVLFPYVGSPAVYRCPADRSTVRNEPGLLRTRTYSISLWLNSDIETAGNASEAKGVHTLSQIVDPPPSQTWVFIDEHPLCIDDGIFLIAGGPTNWCNWCSYRGDQHKNGANLTFADGHVDHHRWRCRRNFPNFTSSWVPTLDADDCADFDYLQNGLPRSPQPNNEPPRDTTQQ